MNLIKYNVNDVYCIGDIHGHFDGIPYFIKTYNIRNSVLIFCGDIGFGFEKPAYYTQVFDKISNVCRKYNDHIVFLRGNHDDPSYFDGEKVNRKWIKAVPDYTVIQTFLTEDETMACPMKTFLLVGGGVSIDRCYRMTLQEGKLFDYAKYHGVTYEEAKTAIQTNYYWDDELPVYKPEILDEIKECGINIDYVCTHSSPKFCKPTDKDGIRGWMMNDETLEDAVNTERNVMTEIYNKVRADGHPLKAWYNGHFHRRGYESFDDVKFYHLDMEKNRMDAQIVY